MRTLEKTYLGVIFCCMSMVARDSNMKHSMKHNDGVKFI